MADKKSRGLNLEKEITDAIRGIKAIKREAKEALKTLKALENNHKDGGFE